jgi:hypothetical protein
MLLEDNSDQWRTLRVSASKCHHVAVELGALITSNGVRQVCPFCLDCGKKLDGPIAYKTLYHELGIEPESVPIHRDQEAEPEPCDVCERETHLHMHHWAPRHLFRDKVPIPGYLNLMITEADMWPTSRLCPECHTRWHRIVTPNMNQRRKAS